MNLSSLIFKDGDRKTVPCQASMWAQSLSWVARSFQCAHVVHVRILLLDIELDSKVAQGDRNTSATPSELSSE